ncbi:MAG: M3 family metallopeptidase, partial [Bacteroidota bacterium]
VFERIVEAPHLVLGGLKTELGEMISLMNHMGYLDLDSRVGKAPGGYNYPLMEVGVPFIFMNAAGSQTDVITMLHESGHAVHSFLTRNIRLNALKRTPSEVAELAAMSMELLCLEGYEEFYQDSEELRRAKKNQLQRCIVVFPWIASVDAFQQWIYDHPGHSQEERNAAWTRLYYRFHGHTVDWTGYEEMLASMWLRQGHIFDVPFYYIEYAIAQLGALAVWRNYKQQPEQGLQQYLDALALGYTRTIPEIYEAAGIRFDFSADYVAQSIDFCLEAYQAL